MQLVISCEHGGNEVPARWAALFAESQRFLSTHRGYDPGAFELAKEIANYYQSPMHASTITRLLVDLNRSLDSPELFSSMTRSLPIEERDLILNRHYFPYRQEVEKRIKELIEGSTPVLHLSIHSFTPVRKGEVRETEIGILFDPSRRNEKHFSEQWKRRLEEALPENYRVCCNYPYRGTDDAFTTALRRQWSGDDYVGIELEVNQKLVRGSPKRWQQIKDVLVTSLAQGD